MSKSLAMYYKSGKEPFVVFDLAKLQKSMDHWLLQARMVELRNRRLVEDITQVRHPQPVKDSWKVRGGTLYVTFVPGKRVRAYRKYRFNGGRTLEVKTLSEMSL